MKNRIATGKGNELLGDVTRVVEAQRVLSQSPKPVLGTIVGLFFLPLAGVLLQDVAAPWYVQLILAVGFALAVINYLELWIIRRRLEAVIALLDARTNDG